MKNLIFVSLFLLFGQFSIAQRHEIGVKLGMSNIVGDIGKTNYIQISSEGVTKTPLILGASYKRNLNPHQGIKVALNYHYTTANDKKTEELYRYNRQITNSNNVLEGKILFEYNFFPINNEVRKSMWSPYIFGGFSELIWSFIEFIIFFNHSNKVVFQKNKINLL